MNRFFSTKANNKRMCRKSDDKHECHHQAQGISAKPRPKDGHHNACEGSCECSIDWCGFEFHVALLMNFANGESRGTRYYVGGVPSDQLDRTRPQTDHVGS